MANKRISCLATIAFILLTALGIGQVAVYQNYYLVFLLVSVFLGLIVAQSDLIPIVAIVVIIPFADWAVESGLLAPQVMWAPELLSGLIFVKAVTKRVAARKKVNLFGMRLVMVFLAVTVASLIYNDIGVISALLFLRLLFRYYLLFLGIINLDLSERSMRLVNSILVCVFASQLPLSIVKLLVYGQGETPLGLSSHSAPTYIPLIAIGFLLSYYFLYRRSIVYLLASLGFVGFSIIGGKRAFVFFLSILLLWIGWFLRGRIKHFSRYAALTALILFSSTYLAFRLIPTLNPQREVWGEFDPAHAMDYARSYTLASSPVDGRAIGRTSATISVFEELHGRGLLSLAVGSGPGSIMKSTFRGLDHRESLETEYEVAYGWTGLNWLGIQVGYIGAAIYLLLFYLILRKALHCLGKERDPYWRSFGLGMAAFSFTILFMSIAYSRVFGHDSASAFYFCLAGFLVKRTLMYEDAPPLPVSWREYPVEYGEI
ncbi:MAG: hypothetical protein JSU70_00340 [Phycisphaerales bacterium]|nr:MAG: hypothetical protein JSU70_00340 [Phycisphaerales bacterium]